MQRLTFYESGNIKDMTFNSVMFELPEPQRRFGTINSKLYWPIDESGSPADMPDDFVGMFPIYPLGKPFSGSRDYVGLWKAYVVIRMVNGQEQYFIGDKVVVDYNEYFSPEMLARHSDKLAGPYPDIWIDGGAEDGNNADPERWYFLAVRKPGIGGAPAWFTGEKQGSSEPLIARLRKAEIEGVTSSDPRLVQIMQANADKKQRDDAMATYKARNEQRQQMLAQLRAIPKTFAAAPGSCYPFYNYAKSTALGFEPGVFVRAFDINPTEACSYVPESLYISMERDGLIRSGGTADKPPTKTFAQQLEEFNRQAERANEARKLEQATTGRTCVTVVHVRYC